MNPSDRNERLKNLSPAKRAALLKALKNNPSAISRPAAIPRLANRDSAHLSFAQQRLWFVDQLEPGSPLYNQPAAIRLTGELDVRALEQSINRVQLRHETLRTRIETRQGTAVQVVEPWQHQPLPVIDLSELSDEQRQQEAARIAEQEAGEGFDLSSGSLMRVKLVRRSDQQHDLLYTMHHIVTDDWSMNILIRETDRKSVV
jgi:hypothetical protein